MPMTTIPVESETLNLTKQFKEEFRFHSLDRAIKVGLQWARAFAYIDSQQRKSLNHRMSLVEEKIAQLETVNSVLFSELFKKQKKEKKEK